MDSSTRYKAPGFYVQDLREDKYKSSSTTACDRRRKLKDLELEKSRTLVESQRNRTWTTEEFTKHQERLSLVNILFNEQKDLLFKLAKIENSIIRSQTDETFQNQRWEDVIAPTTALLRDLQSQHFRN